MGWVAMIFSSGAFGCLALKTKHERHFPMCSFAWAAMWGQKNLSCIRSSMRSRPRWPTSSWHPLRATSLCTVGRTNCKRVSFDSLACLYKTPLCITKLCCSLLYWLNSGGSVFLDQSFSSVPYLSLCIIWPKTGSASCAHHQSSKIIWATCWRSWIAPTTCRS